MRQRDRILKELVSEWLRKADDDLQAGTYLLERPAVLGGIIAFHAQQAVEKYMKALLTWRQVDFPKTHDLGELLNLLTIDDPSLREELRAAVVLTDYGVEVRYPGDLPQVSLEEAREAIDLAADARDTIFGVLPPNPATAE